MIKLIKWTIYGVLGYLLYELYQGLVAERPEPSRSGTPEPHGDPQAKALSGSAGEGASVRTQDASGASVSHRVGRGVV